MQASRTVRALGSRPSAASRVVRVSKNERGACHRVKVQAEGAPPVSTDDVASAASSAAEEAAAEEVVAAAVLPKKTSRRRANPYLATISLEAANSAVELEAAGNKDVHENGVRSSSRTKMICTIGPSSCTSEVLESLAVNGMNVARLNMCHGTHDWHRSVIEKIRSLNEEKGYSIAIMVDTEGSEIHTRELLDPIKAEEGEEVVFTIRSPGASDQNGAQVISVSYDSFIEDVEVGDTIIVDGGMVMFQVVAKAGPDVTAVCQEPGLVLSRANLTFKRNGELIRGRNALLPVISAKDWQDIDFAIGAKVDFLAVSFVKTADVMKNLRSYLQTRCPNHYIELVAKIESYDCIAHLDDIIAASDAVMVARGDLGAQVAVEDVPSIQKYAVVKARQLGKPSIVASQLLQSMIEYPIPTRAEVADVGDVIRQRADALMLSAESAAGRYPIKALGVLRSVALRMEAWMAQDKFGSPVLPQIGGSPDGRTSEEVCAAAAMLANNLKAAAIFVYTRRGYMAHFLSRCRPDCPIFAFTDQPDVRQRLNLRWGVQPFRVEFSAEPEDNVQRTFQVLKLRGFVKEGDLVVVVSDLRPHNDTDIIRSVQVRRVA